MGRIVLEFNQPLCDQSVHQCLNVLAEDWSCTGHLWNRLGTGTAEIVENAPQAGGHQTVGKRRGLQLWEKCGTVVCYSIDQLFFPLCQDANNIQ